MQVLYVLLIAFLFGPGLLLVWWPKKRRWAYPARDAIDSAHIARNE